MKGKFYGYLLRPFREEFIFEIVAKSTLLDSTVVYYVAYVLIIRNCVTYCIAPLAKSEEYLPSPDCTEEEEGSAQSKRVVTFSSRVRWKTSQNSLRN